MSKIYELEIAPFDAGDYLDSEDTIAEYPSAALKNPNPNAFLDAVGDVAKASGISEVATNAEIGRDNFYKALKSEARAQFDTVRRLFNALGVKLDVASSHTQV